MKHKHLYIPALYMLMLSAPAFAYENTETTGSEYRLEKSDTNVYYPVKNHELPGVDDTFAMLDKYPNNALTPEEYNAGQNLRPFDHVDVDKDGAISRTEFYGYAGTGNDYAAVEPAAGDETGDIIHYNHLSNRGDTFAMLDRNQDGVLTREEYNNARNQPDFSSVDRNDDDVISRAEYNGYNNIGEGNTMERTSTTQMTVHRNGTIGNSRISFRDIDLNKNGYISKHEWYSFLKNHPNM